MAGRLLEVFSSVQGEGAHIGERHLFLRLAGCNLRCRYCDTPVDAEPPATFPVYLPAGCGRRELRLANPVEATALAEALACFEPRGRRRREAGIRRPEAGSRSPEQQEVAQVSSRQPQASSLLHAMVSFTGGEPLLQPEFVEQTARLLMAAGHRRLYLETNGTLPGELRSVVDMFAVICMDIKLPSAYGGPALWSKHERFLAVRPAKTQVKVTVTRDTTRADFKRAVKIVKCAGDSIPLIIQPVWPLETPAEMLLELQEVALYELADVRIIAQQHQLLGMR